VSDDTFIQKFASQYEWQIAPAKRRFRFRKEVNKGMRESHRLALTMKGVVDRALDDVEGLQASDYSTYQIFEAGDLAFKLIDLENIKTSRVGLVPRRGIMSPAYIRLTPTHRDADTRFYAWFFFAVYFNNIFNGMGGGVRQNLTPSDLLEFPIPLPDLASQRQIADFLDRETARIDLLIEKKQRLVALLGEKYEATASQLSTGERTQEEKFDSDIDWLGSIPKSWSVEKLSWHFYAAKGKDAQKYTKEYCGANEGEYPVYSGQTANEGVMGRIDTYDYDFGETGVLFATTVGAKAMDLRHLQGKFSLSQNCMIIIPRQQIPLKFYRYQMRVLFRKERQLIPDHMQASFRVEDLYRYRIAVPPMDHATEIGAKIEKAESALKAVVEPVNASIDRLKEYRSALITAAVTGQIDVSTYSKSGATDRRLDAIQEEMGA
jgi:type I restriction enzyme S subunit